MKCNLGKVDRIIRTIISIILFFVALFTDLWVLYILGGIVFLTALTGFCLLYIPFKINTCKK